MNKYIKTITNGIIMENPTFVLLLGMCPTLVITTSAVSGLSMGLATTSMPIHSSVMVSLLKRLIPDAVRIPALIVVAAGFVTVLQMAIKACMSALDQSLGTFIPLIVASCTVLGRAESTVSKSSVGISPFNDAGIGLGFTIGLTLLATVREMLGGGIFSDMGAHPGDFSVLLFVLPPGTSIALGLLIGIHRAVTKKR